MTDRAPPSPVVGFPLSPQQRRLWSLHGPAAGPFTGRSVLSVRGDLDVETLRAAVRRVAARHEILRTAFDHPAGVDQPVQIVEEGREPDFRADAGSDEPDFDLRGGALFRVRVRPAAGGEHRVELTLPSLCADAEGLRALADEIRETYAALRSGRESSRGEPPQIADVAEWARQTAEPGEALRASLDVEKPLAVRFPWRSEAGGDAAFRPERREIPLPAAVSGRLRELAGGDDDVLRSLLLTAWLVLLWKLAGRARVAVGTLHDGRDVGGLEDLPGVLARYLPLAPALDPRASFRDAARLVGDRDARLDAVQHELGWDGRTAAAFDFGALPPPADAAGSTWETLERDARIDGPEVRLVVRAREQAIAVHLEHDAARVEEDEAGRLRDRLLVVLEQVAEDPDRRLGDLEILGSDERRRLVTDFNATRSDVANDRCIHRVIEEAAARFPDRIAVEFGDEALRYADLDARANRLARRLVARGVTPGALVGISLPRSTEMVVGILAVLKAGGAYVPLDPNYPRERLDFMVEDTGMRFLVTRSPLLGGVERPGVQTVLLDAEAEAIAAEPPDDPGVDVAPDSLVYVIYTSGSTGRPKGVMITHRGLMLSNGARIERFGDAVEKFLLLSSFSFDSSVVGIFWTLTVGGTLFLVPEAAQRDLRELGRVIERTRVSHLLTLPSFYALLLEEAPAGSLRSLRTVIVAGEPTRRSAIERHRRLLPQAGMFSEYGATETTVFSSVSDLLQPGLPVAPLGLPIANCEMYVLDPDLRPLPVGVTGEVWFGGLAISPGYLNRPGLTAERFLPDPFCGRPGARMYRSGDLARHHASGEMEFLGRIDNQVKIRGFRIELEEIEVALSAHDAVQETVVLALDAAAWRGGAAGGGDAEPGGLRLAAYVVLHPGAEASARDLRGFVAASLPDYMVPAEILFLEAIPRTPNGKVDRDALPAPGAARASAADGTVDEARTPEEALLARVWKEVLGLESVGIHDNFFEVGGDSILSIQIVSRAAREGLALTPMQAFQHQTIAELAAVAGARRETAAEQHEVTGDVPLTAVQRWFCSLDVPNRSHWNMPLLLEMDSVPETAHLEAAADALARHHDALRLRLARGADGWEQRIAPFEGHVPVDVEDLTGLGEEEERAELQRRAAGYQARLDAEKGCLMRLVVFRRSAGRPPLLFWVLHHLAGDIVSWRILLEDLQTALEQAAAGEDLRLPAKTTSFRQWAQRVAELAAGRDVLEEVPFWLDQLRSGSARVPADFPDGRERNTEDSLEIVRVELDAAETDAVLHEIPQAFHSQIHEALLSALARTLGAWTGDGAATVEVELHGREESRLGDVDLSRTVGWFTASYPVRLDVAGAPDASSALRAVRRRLRAVPGRGFGYGLARWLSPASDAVDELRRAARPDVNFNYLGRFDQALGPDSRFRLAPPELGFGPDRDPRGERTCGIDVVGWVVGEKLRMEWYFSRNLHRRDRIESLAGDHLAKLRELIAAARSGEAAEALPAGVDDFDWGEDAPETVVAAVRSAAGGVASEPVDVYPLSPLQEGLLYHALADPDSGMYVNQCLLELRGDLDPAAMEEAWRRGAAAHPILRTFFVWEGLGAPAQAVVRAADPPFERHDLASLTPEDRRARRDALLEERRRGGFDPARAPLMRLDLVRAADRRHELIWSFHHLLLDGWSMFSVLRDVFAAYEELRGGGDPAVESPPPFRDHVAWLRRQDRAAAESYWRRTLRGFTAPTPLPGAADRAAAPAVGLEDAAFAELRLDADTTADLEALARRLRVTMNTVLQLAWATVLARWSGNDDVVFGAIVSGRPPDLPGFERMVGLFINTLPVRVGLRPGDTVAGALARVQESTAELRQYEFSRLVDVQKWSEIPAGRQIFESILLFENYRKEMPLDAMLESLQVGDVGWFEHTNYPIAFLAIPEERFLLRLVTHRKRVDPETGRRILEHVRHALESMLAAPEGPLADVSLLGADEEARLRAEWGAIAGAETEPVHVEFARRAAERPEAEAVRDPRGSVTYGELDRRSNRLARELRERGVGPESRVGVCLSPSVRLPEALLAVLKAGGAYVPLDPDYPEARLATMARDSGAKVIVGETEELERLRAAMDSADPVFLALDAEARAIAARDDSPLPDAEAHPRQLAYVIYTSGSTGTPKGVEVDHGALSNLVAWHRREYSIGPEDRATLVAAFSFDASVWETWPYLAAGAALHVPDEETRLAGPPLLKWMGDRGVTACFLPTPMAGALLADGAEWPGSLRAVLTGGDRLARGPARELPFRFVNHYGPTENAVVATAGAVAAGSELPPIGRAIDGVGAYVLDARMRPVPAGVPGQLWLGGASVARGYAGRADLTAERFLPDPFGKPGARMYATGDRVRRRDDGELDFLGRIDRQVKLRGFRIETGEIESVLARHPGVKRCVVELREDRPGRPELVAYLVANGAAAAVEELKAHLRARLPDYMVPSAFVTLDDLPLTPNGKIDRAALPAPDREAHGAAKTAVAPRNEIEEKLAGVWKRLLDLEKVGVDDNFFDLGANSLLLVRARTEIRNVLDTEIRIVDLFEHPTVAALATYTAGRQAGAEAPVADDEADAEVATRAAGRSRLLKRRRRTEETND